MKPKIITNMPMSEYQAIDAVNHSLLKAYMRSPAHAKAYREQAQESTDAMLFGRRLHEAILEPDKAARWAVKPQDMSFATKDGKVWRETFAGSEIVPFADAKKINEILEALMAHKVAGEFLRRRTQTEISLFAHDEATGLPLKARLDAIANSTIIDIKSCEDSSPEGWQKASSKYKYHLQAAFYIDQARRCGFIPQTMLFIAVEKTAPYNVCVYQFDDASIARGREQYRHALDAYAESVQKDNWPGYSEKIEICSLPPWEMTDKPKLTESYELEEV